MEDGGEQETNANLLDASGNALGTEIDLHAELLEHVSGPAHRGRSAVSMLGHARATRGRDDRGQRRDVEGGETITASSACVEKIALHVHRRRHRTGGASKPSELVDRLPFHAEGHEQACDLYRCGVATHDPFKGSRCLGLSKGLPPHQFGDRVDHEVPRAARRMKLARIVFPSLVSTDSGWNWTPYVGCRAWRSPMIVSSAVHAVTTNSSGSDDRSTISE